MEREKIAVKPKEIDSKVSFEIRGKLASSFRTGRVKVTPVSSNSNFRMFMTSQVINYKIDQLYHLFSSRRGMRETDIQNQIDYLTKQHANGYRA